METIQKNIVTALIDKDVPAILHGCNSQGVMGSGLAREIKARLPHAYQDYVKFCQDHNPFSSTRRLLGSSCESVGPHGIVYNCITQEFYGREKKKYVDDQAIFTSLLSTSSQLQERGISEIGIPYLFCCGLGGGNWDEVMEQIKFTFGGFDIKIFKL